LSKALSKGSICSKVILVTIRNIVNRLEMFSEGLAGVKITIIPNTLWVCVSLHAITYNLKDTNYLTLHLTSIPTSIIFSL